MSNTAVYINNISAFLPNEPVSNEQMEHLLGQVGLRPSRARKIILRSNKIEQRYYAIDPDTLQPSHTTAQLAAEAVKKLEKENFSVDDISLLCASSTIPDQIMPNHAVMVHGEIGSPPCEVVSTSGVCVCGVTALKYTWLSILANEHKNAVACAAESSSLSMLAHNFSDEIQSRVDQLEKNPEIAFEKDFLRWMLSDGAGAMWLSDTPNAEGLSLKIDWIDILSYANEQPACMYAGAIKNDDSTLTGWRTQPPTVLANEGYFNVKQDVKQLNEHVLHLTVEKALSAVRNKRHIQPGDYAVFVPHYSSGYFRDRVESSLKAIDFHIPQERWFTNLYQKGNTGSASIYILLEELFNAGSLKKDDKILCYIPESGRFTSAFMQLTVV